MAKNLSEKAKEFAWEAELGAGVGIDVYNAIKEGGTELLVKKLFNMTEVLDKELQGIIDSTDNDGWRLGAINAKRANLVDIIRPLQSLGALIETAQRVEIKEDVEVKIPEPCVGCKKIEKYYDGHYYKNSEGKGKK